MFEPLVNSSFISSILIHIGLLTATCLCLILYLTSKDSRIATYLKALNGPRGLPIVGNALSFAKPRDKLIPIFMLWAKQFGYCAGFWIANIPYVCIAKPDYVEKILSSNVHINKGKDYESFLESWLGTGLLTAPREKWHQRRKLLTPTFHFKILEDFIPIFNEQAKLLNVLLEKQRQKQDSFDICPFILRCTLDVICETAMGEKINAQIGGDSDYVRNVCGIADIVIIKGLNPLYRNEYIWKMTSLGKLEEKYLNDLHGFTDRVIRDRKTERKRREIIEERRNSITGGSPTPTKVDNPVGTKTRKAFLDLLLDLQESENALTDSDIREEVDTFMFEGHDTTGTNLEWAILMLACYPEYQSRVHEELDGVFGDDPERDITTADLTRLKYLECFIKETLRLYPSVPFFMRRVDEDIALDKDKIVPKGTTILITPYILHRYPKSFPDPEKFDPERFTPENSVGRHPYAYVPFSAGPRNCIGQKFALMEEKIILATLMRTFKLEAVDTRETALLLPDFILRPKNGIKVRLLRRV